MAATLSPLQLQAASGLLQNQGIQSNPATTSVSAFDSIPLFGSLFATIAGLDPTIEDDANCIANLQTLASSSCPALADSIPIEYVTNIGNLVTTSFPITSPTQANPGLTGIITLTTDAYYGNGDLSKFAQIFSAAAGYAETTNTYINSSVNANTYLGGTFTNMDNLVSGSLTEVNLATEAFADDLRNAGQYINLADLANYGSPLALIQQISRRAGTISPLIGPLTAAGVNENIVLNLDNTDNIITDAVQKLMYNALQNITGDALSQILQILDVWTPNINTLADLLNPAVMFPNSYPTLTVPTADGSVPIFVTPIVEWPNPSPDEDRAILDNEADGRVVEQPLACAIRQNLVTTPAPTDANSNTGSGQFYTPNSNLLEKVKSVGGISYERLSIITDPGLALVNKALACSLDQITNLGRMTLPQLSDAYSAVETNKGLPLIEAQTQPVPQDSLDFYTNSLAIGSGDNGTILMTDIMGSALGLNVVDNLNNCVAIINSIDTTALEAIYDAMFAALPDPAAVEPLIVNAQTEINNIIASNPTATTELNTYFSAIGAQLAKEGELQSKATLDLTAIAANSQQSTMAFVQSLPKYANDTKVGGTAQFLEDIVDIDTQYGQAIVAAMREGRTTEGLAAAGVGTASNAVPDNPSAIPPQAPLIPSVYSERQARSLLNNE